MSGACKIDNVDMRDLGVLIPRGGDAQLLLFPRRSRPLSNDWFEHDGLDIDWSSLRWSPKQVDLEFYLSAPDKTAFNNRLSAVEALLYSPGNRTVELGALGVTTSLQFTDITKLETRGGLHRSGAKSALFTARFMDNTPTVLFSGTALRSGGRIPTRVLLGGLDFSEYGIIIHEVYNTALRIRPPKKGLSIEVGGQHGAIVDTSFTPKRSTDVINIECSMLLPKSDFWPSYRALFAALDTDGPLVLELANGRQINCYFEEMSGIKRHRSERVFIEFTLKFIVL